MKIHRKLDAIFELLKAVALSMDSQATYTLPAEFVEQMPDRITMAGGADLPPLPYPYKWVDVSRGETTMKTYEWVKSR